MPGRDGNDFWEIQADALKTVVPLAVEKFKLDRAQANLDRAAGEAKKTHQLNAAEKLFDLAAKHDNPQYAKMGMEQYSQAMGLPPPLESEFTSSPASQLKTAETEQKLSAIQKDKAIEAELGRKVAAQPAALTRQGQAGAEPEQMAPDVLFRGNMIERKPLSGAEIEQTRAALGDKDAAKTLATMEKEKTQTPHTVEIPSPDGKTAQKFQYNTKTNAFDIPVGAPYKVKSQVTNINVHGGGSQGNIAPMGAVSAGVYGQLNESALDGLKEGDKNVVKLLVNYKMPLPSAFALKTPYWQGILQRASTYDPSFDATQYPTRLATRRAFTSGKQGQNITGLNTAVGHINSLVKAYTDLDQSKVQTVNQVANIMSKYLPVTPDSAG